MESAVKGEWSREEEKAFENAIAKTHNTMDEQQYWEKISSMVQSKSMEELKQHYGVLVQDINAIEAGLVSLPRYLGEEEETNMDKQTSSASDRKKIGSTSGFNTSRSSYFPVGMIGNNDLEGKQQALVRSGSGSKSNQLEKRKGIPWTEEEHRLFLLGLDKCGKGDWRSISRNFVISRTPTQVASHAQKYFIRLNSMNRDRRRTSIHDITNLNNGVAATPQGPITGEQTNTTTSSTPNSYIGPSFKHHRSSHSPAMPALAMPRMASAPGQIISAIGTPVTIPPPGHHYPPPYTHMAYPVVPAAMHQ
ncbi:hypothetical protein C5167_022958 [Papaver somniferum]|uniref:Uncharacterized protein n=1 Tax=Papaver somniferum TaxID=3469 RepID=A0A4Y7JME3_PAPSO|nr:transcription factor SRM1-like [Papaver somniferum]RZC61192.1 hypothetical protein C5167_022958 [Papaver somniferum]